MTAINAGDLVRAFVVNGEPGATADGVVLEWNRSGPVFWMRDRRACFTVRTAEREEYTCYLEGAVVLKTRSEL